MSHTDSLSVAGKVAIVTGSGKENGIGGAIALVLARAGARVTLNYVSERTAPRAAEMLGKIEAVAGKGSVIAVQADVTTAGGVDKLVKATLDGFKVDHIDILVNNAAIVLPGPLLQSPPEDTFRVFDVSVFGPLRLIQAVVPHMPRGGRIVNIGSAGSKLGIGMMASYASAKAAMDTLSFAMAEELGRGKGITINTVAPGPVPTDSLDPNAPGTDDMKKWLVGLTRAEERVGSLEDITDVVLFLASEKSRWITGQHISASGGITGP